MSALDIYQANYGNSHEAGLNAVYSAGVVDGSVAPVATIPAYPDLSAQLVAANAEIVTLQAQLESLASAAHAAATPAATDPVAPVASPTLMGTITSALGMGA